MAHMGMAGIDTEHATGPGSDERTKMLKRQPGGGGVQLELRHEGI